MFAMTLREEGLTYENARAGIYEQIPVHILRYPWGSAYGYVHIDYVRALVEERDSLLAQVEALKR